MNTQFTAPPITTPSTTTPPRTADDEISLVAIANVILRGRWWIITCGILGVAISAIVKRPGPPTYTSSAEIMPESKSETGGMGSLATELGLRSPSGGNDVQLYQYLIKSPILLGPVVQSEYTFMKGGQTQRGTLLDFYNIQGKGQAQMEGAMGRLRSGISSDNAGAGVMRMSVRMSDRVIGRQILENLLARLMEFNFESRRTKVRAERRFTEGRVAAVGAELRAAEDRLQDFLQTNRDFTTSPRLKFDNDRLARDVNMRQEIYTQLAKSAEQAKIEEVRDTPTFTILSAPQAPISADPQPWIKGVITGLLFGLIVGMGLAFLYGSIVRARETRADEFEEFLTLRRQAMGELKRPLASLRRATSTPRR